MGYKWNLRKNYKNERVEKMKVNTNNILTKFAVLSISLMLCSAQAINGVIPKMKQSLGISQVQVEMLSTIPAITVIVFIFLSSFIAKKIGLKKTINIGLFLAGVGGMLPMFVSSFKLIFIGRIVLGAGLGLFNSLAVTLINRIYTGDVEASLLGIRNSMEGIGQSILTFVAGILLNIGWHYSFAVYIFAFPLIALFTFFVPDIDNAVEEKSSNKEKMNPMVYLMFMFAILLVCNGISISVRFPSIATEILGENFNSSNYLAIMPIIGILAGFAFGKVYKIFGTITLYIGLLALALSNILIGFSNGNFIILLMGVLFSGIPSTWCFPFIFITLGKITTKGTQALANSLIFVGCNIGGFLVPFVMEAMQLLSRSDSLAAPFPIYAGILILIFIGMIICKAIMKKHNKVLAS